MDAILGAEIRGLVDEPCVEILIREIEVWDEGDVLLWLAIGMTGMACTIWMGMWMGMILSDGAWMAALIISAMVDC